LFAGKYDTVFNLDPLDLLVRVPVLLLALTVHEFAHAYSAYRLGDPTAFRLGRCTLNPIAHLDPIGAICLLFAPIGWAKPVPVNPLNFRNPGRDDIIVSAAGPLSNLLQALVFALVLRGLGSFALPLKAAMGTYAFRAAVLFGFSGVLINVGLAVFNLLPVFPLDGFHVCGNLMKGASRQRFYETARYGQYILIGLILLGTQSQFNPLGIVMRPAREFFLKYVTGTDALVSIYRTAF
jgi:Zn-dependent protease